MVSCKKSALVTEGKANTLTELAPEREKKAEVSKSRYFRLKSDTYNWGTDDDTWIYADDTYKVLSYDPQSGEFLKRRTGLCNGLYKKLVTRVESEEAWGLWNRDPRIEQELSVGGTGIIGGTHLSIEFRDSDSRVMIAECDNPVITVKRVSKHLSSPPGKSLVLFSDLVESIRTATKKRENKSQ
ncbi:MAG: hypothetical protein ACSHX6_06715 [Akkermansiaceae bacterium]